MFTELTEIVLSCTNIVQTLNTNQYEKTATNQTNLPSKVCIKMFLIFIFIFIAGRTNRGKLHVGSWLLWRSRTLAGGVTFFSSLPKFELLCQYFLTLFCQHFDVDP